MVEMILYLTITLSMVIFTARILDQESERQERSMAAVDLQTAINAAQAYMVTGKPDVMEKLLQITITDSPLIGEIPIDMVVDAGLLPQIYEQGGGSGLSSIYDQEYKMFGRIVYYSDTGDPDTGAPPVTVLKSDSVIDGLDGPNPVFKSPLTDGNVDNDELNLEVVLVTTGRDGSNSRIPRQDGMKIITETQMPAAGFLTRDGADADLFARGPYGAWELNLREFEQWLGSDFPDVETFPGSNFSGAGHFASLISLSRYGVLQRDTAPKDASVVDEYDRCEGLTQGTEEYERCVFSNEVFSDITFQAWDSDGDGVPDQAPGISGAWQINMADVEDNRADDGTMTTGVPTIRGLTILDMNSFSSAAPDGTIDQIAKISNAAIIAMRDPIRNPGGEVIFPNISNVFGLSCSEAEAANMTSSALTLACAETRMPGNIVFGSDSSLFYGNKSDPDAPIDITSNILTYRIPGANEAQGEPISYSNLPACPEEYPNRNYSVEVTEARAQSGWDSVVATRWATTSVGEDGQNVDVWVTSGKRVYSCINWNMETNPYQCEEEGDMVTTSQEELNPYGTRVVLITQCAR